MLWVHSKPPTRFEGIFIFGIRLPRPRTMDSWVAYRDFRFLWFANFCAFTGQWLQLLSIGWLVKELSAGSGVGGLLVLSASALNTLPGLAVNPLTGVLGDRLDRRKLAHRRAVHRGGAGPGFRLPGRFRLHPPVACLRLRPDLRLLPGHHSANPAGDDLQHGPPGRAHQRLRNQHPHRHRHAHLRSLRRRHPHRQHRVLLELRHGSRVVPGCGVDADSHAHSLYVQRAGRPEPAHHPHRRHPRRPAPPLAPAARGAGNRADFRDPEHHPAPPVVPAASVHGGGAPGPRRHGRLPAGDHRRRRLDLHPLHRHLGLPLPPRPHPGGHLQSSGPSAPCCFPSARGSGRHSSCWP